MGKKESLEIAFESLMKEVFSAVVALCLEDTKQKELNYVKTPVSLPNGGNYLISVLHIDGPKLDLQLLRDISKSQEDKPEEAADAGNVSKT